MTQALPIDNAISFIDSAELPITVRSIRSGGSANTVFFTLDLDKTNITDEKIQAVESAIIKYLMSEYFISYVQERNLLGVEHLGLHVRIFNSEGERVANFSPRHRLNLIDMQSD